jgi:futalosine hydrolase
VSSYGLDSDPWSASASVTGRGSSLLVVTSVPAEREAIERGVVSARRESPAGVRPPSSLTIIDTGVGVANAAAVTAASLSGHAFTAVVSTGIAGGIGVPPGGLALGTRSVAADLGADSPSGFLSLDELGLGSSTVECDIGLTAGFAKLLPDAVRGAVLTVSTVTGTAGRADWLRARHPDAVAEAMEGFGAATAAARAGIPFVEIRAVSNVVGPRDREAWQIPDALAALERVGVALATLGA